MRVKCLAQEHNMMSPGFETGPLISEVRSLTMGPPHLHIHVVKTNLEFYYSVTGLIRAPKGHANYFQGVQGLNKYTKSYILHVQTLDRLWIQRGSKNTPSRFMLQKPKASAGVMDQFARMQT